MTTQQESRRPGTQVLETFIDAISWNEATERLLGWASSNQPRGVCLCNVHSAVTALDDQQLAAALRKADMVLADGAPIAWVMRRKGYNNQTRIAGPDLMWRLCESAERHGVGAFLFGSTPETLDRLQSNIKKRFPDLDVRGSLSPRFGAWTEEEEQTYIDTINATAAGLVFVGLGCPRQEIWMARQQEQKRVSGVLIGVGAAFDFHAGTVKRAPLIYQQLGLEWLYRLLAEPRRLWRRYLITNTRFLLNLPGTLSRSRTVRNATTDRD